MSCFTSLTKRLTKHGVFLNENSYETSYFLYKFYIHIMRYYMTVKFGHEMWSVIPNLCMANIRFCGDEIWTRNLKFTHGVPKIWNVHLARDARFTFLERRGRSSNFVNKFHSYKIQNFMCISLVRNCKFLDRIWFLWNMKFDIYGICTRNIRFRKKFYPGKYHVW